MPLCGGRLPPRAIYVGIDLHELYIQHGTSLVNFLVYGQHVLGFPHYVLGSPNMVWVGVSSEVSAGISTSFCEKCVFCANSAKVYNFLIYT